MLPQRMSRSALLKKEDEQSRSRKIDDGGRTLPQRLPYAYAEEVAMERCALCGLSHLTTDAADHATICAEALFRCPNHNAGCTTQLKRTELCDHLQKCAASAVVCYVCGVPQRRDELGWHLLVVHTEREAAFERCPNRAHTGCAWQRARTRGLGASSLRAMASTSQPAAQAAMRCWQSSLPSDLYSHITAGFVKSFHATVETAAGAAALAVPPDARLFLGAAQEDAQLATGWPPVEWLRLPDDVLGVLLAFVDTLSLRQLRATSRGWRALCVPAEGAPLGAGRGLLATRWRRAVAGRTGWVRDKPLLSLSPGAEPDAAAGARARGGGGVQSSELAAHLESGCEGHAEGEVGRVYHDMATVLHSSPSRQAGEQQPPPRSTSRNRDASTRFAIRPKDSSVPQASSTSWLHLQVRELSIDSAASVSHHIEGAARQIKNELLQKMKEQAAAAAAVAAAAQRESSGGASSSGTSADPGEKFGDGWMQTEPSE